jgi:hypothetical protein
MTVIKFDTYTIPNLQSFNYNFGDSVPQTMRMPMMDGGLDLYGNDRAPSRIGRVDVSFRLVAATRAEMQALRDAVMAMDTWGKKVLYWTPTGSSDTRFCIAKANAISIPQRPAQHSDLWQQVNITWQVDVPFWYVNEYGGAYWGDGESAWGEEVPWGGSPVTQACSGFTTDFTVTNDGNAIAIPRLAIVPSAGQECSNPVFQRLVGGVVEDEVSWTGALDGDDGDSLRINCRASTVLHNLADDYDNLDFDHPDWLRLKPGSNTIRVKFGDPTDAAAASVWYFHTYK